MIQLATLLLAPALVIGQESRDLLTQYGGKRVALSLQTVPGSPFGGGGAPASSLLGSNNVWTGTNEYDGTAQFDAAVVFNSNVDLVGVVTVGGTSTFNGTATFNFGLTMAESSSVTTGKSLSFGGSGQFAELMFNSTQTPDTATLGLPIGSRSFLFIEDGDEGFDFAHPQQTTPTVIVHSATQSTTQWISITHNATNGVVDVGTGLVSIPDGAILPLDAVLQLGTTTDSTSNYISADSTQVPDALMIYTSTVANTAHVAEVGDSAVNLANGPCGATSCTNPQMVVHEGGGSTTEFQAVGVTGLSGRFVKTLVESAATSVVIIPVAAATSVSGQMLYTVHARDATNSQTRSGRIIWNGVAEGTTATCVLGTAEELDNTPTGTLTAAITCTSPANNQIQLLINAASSLTQTTLEAYVTVILVGAGEALPQ